jgi:tRNA threonylcarbamoyladenosine biosynthesis protein TsaE
MTDHHAFAVAGIDEGALAALAFALAPAIGDGGAIHLAGELGAGKTTFARALLCALGVVARVKSPTYSLIESYVVDGLAIHHLDLYRIAAVDELEWLGLRDLDVDRRLWLIEWPERAVEALPAPDLIVHLSHAAKGRDLRIEVPSRTGQHWLKSMSAQQVKANS